MTKFAYDRIAAGLTDAASVLEEIKEKVANKPLYVRIPAHVLVEEFMIPNNLDVKDVTKIGRINPRIMSKFIRGEARIDETMASKLGHMFRNGADYWLNLQAEFDEKGSV